MRVPRQVSGALAAVLVGAGALALSAGPTAAKSDPQGPRPAGAPGAGDPYFPFAGNGGYDVQHYGTRPHHAAGARPGAACRLLSGGDDRPGGHGDLDRIQPRLRGLDVQGIIVDGKQASEVSPPAAGVEVEGAAYRQVQDDAARIWELTIQPRPKIKQGQSAPLSLSPTAVRPPGR